MFTNVATLGAFIICLLQLPVVLAEQQQDDSSRMPPSQNQNFDPDNYRNDFYNQLPDVTGSIPVEPATPIQMLSDKINISLSNASTIAENSVGTGSLASTGTANTDSGFLAYIVFVTDADNKLHRVIVDAGNGQVLSSEAEEVPITDATVIPPE